MFIAILNARIFIEVMVFTLYGPEQISEILNGIIFRMEIFSTFRIPNIVIEHHLEEVANAIVEVVKRTRQS